jgi:hypothetical protein
MAPVTALSPDAERILAKVRHGSVSFVELVNLEPGFAGDLSISYGTLVLWAGVSDRFIDALEECKPLIEPTPTSVLVYWHDGAALGLPIAKRPPKNGYKEPHWAPVVWNLRKAALAGETVS